MPQDGDYHDCPAVRMQAGDDWPLNWYEQPDPKNRPEPEGADYGCAISFIRYRDEFKSSKGRTINSAGWYADCEEYAVRVMFCPFCGVKLED